MKLEELLYTTMEKDYFVKPSKDLKSFNGGIIYKDETLMNYLMRTPHMNIDNIKQEIIILSEVKKIITEYRFFMYKDKILGSSQYMLNGKLHLNEFVPEYMKNSAIEYSKLYNPSDIFVIDLSETQNGIKIVEYNFWNASSFYLSNIDNILNQINEIKN
jgi:hypothetical protein